MQIQSNTYSQYGAHVDDSTNFQVYNNIETDSRAAAAVEETYGKLLLYDGRPISAYYFSTSCGTTADGGVWGGDPAKTPYLKSVALQPGRKSLDLTSNQAFAEFIKEKDVTAYAASYPFFQMCIRDRNIDSRFRWCSAAAAGILHCFSFLIIFLLL